MVADEDSTLANTVLQKARMRLSLPPAGSTGDVSTVAIIRVTDPGTERVIVRMGSVVEMNGHGISPSNWSGAGAVAPSHAEAGVLFASNDKVGLAGMDVTIFTDRDPCAYCDLVRVLKILQEK